MNESQKIQWSQSTNLIFWGILLLSIFGCIATVLGCFTGVVDMAKEILSLQNTFSVNKLPPFVQAFYGMYYVSQFLTLIGWAMYIMGLYQFKDIQLSAHTDRLVGRVRSACWIGIAASGLSLISGLFNPFFFTLFVLTGWTLTLISFVKFQNSFSELAHCSDWDSHARLGAADLRSSATLNIWLIFWPAIIFAVALIIGGFAYSHAKHMLNNASDYIFYGMDYVGDTVQGYAVTAIVLGVLLLIAAFVLWIIQFCLRLSGWRKIHHGSLSVTAQTEPEPTPLQTEEPTAKESQTENTPNVTPNDKKKHILWGAIAALAVAVVVLICLLCARPTQEPQPEEDWNMQGDEIDYTDYIYDDETLPKPQITDESYSSAAHEDISEDEPYCEPEPEPELVSPEDVLSSAPANLLVETADESAPHSTPDVTSLAGDDIVYTHVDTQAAFRGGNAAILKHIASKMQYPTAATQNGEEGRVVVSFVIEKDGSVSNVVVVSSVSPSLDAEAVRLVKTLPNFTAPAKINNAPVRSKMSLPINFRL